MSNPTQTAIHTQAEGWAVIAARAAEDKKAVDPVILAMGDLLTITEAFVIVSAGNTRLVKSIVDEIELQIKEAGGPAPRRVEGMADANWVLMDYGDIVVHVFLQETREFYDLERLWADAPHIEWTAQPRAKSAVSS